MATRKKYTREFKQDAVRLVTEQGYNPSEASRNLGIDRGMLGRWVKEFREDEREAFRGNGTLRSDGEELRRLKLEREILGKGGSLLRERVELRFQFIAQDKEGLPGDNAVPDDGREPQRILPLPAASATGSRPGA